jgi:hypothetical protein
MVRPPCAGLGCVAATVTMLIALEIETFPSLASIVRYTGRLNPEVFAHLIVHPPPPDLPHPPGASSALRHLRKCTRPELRKKKKKQQRDSSPLDARPSVRAWLLIIHPSVPWMMIGRLSERRLVVDCRDVPRRQEELRTVQWLHDGMQPGEVRAVFEARTESGRGGTSTGNDLRGREDFVARRREHEAADRAHAQQPRL